MRVAFRVDASSVIGSGHVMRCLTLADCLRDSGADIVFVCRAHDGHLMDTVRRRGHAVESLPTPQTDPALDGYAAWLGVPQSLDADDTLAALGGRGWVRVDWLVVDHYALDEDWEGRMRGCAARILVIDDLADRRHDCDVLLDQNLVADFETRYSGLLPDKAEVLLGPTYALLRPDFAELAGTKRPRGCSTRRILIFMGAVDRGTTLRALQGFVALGRGDIACDVVCFNTNPNIEAIERIAGAQANVVLHGALPSLAPLMAQADIAIGAGGATSWERLCLGLASIVIILAENQRPIAEELDRRGLAMLLGNAADVKAEDFTQAIAAALEKPFPVAQAQTLVDGHGADRVAALLAVAGGAQLCFRLARAQDEKILLDWANDPATRANAFNPEPITPEGHHRWLSARLASPDTCRIFIAETARGVAVGQVRFDLRGGEAIIDYSVAPPFRGHGLGRRLLDEAARLLEPGLLLVGEVLPGNAASHKVFRSLGYVATLGLHGATRYEKRL